MIQTLFTAVAWGVLFLFLAFILARLADIQAEIKKEVLGIDKSQLATRIFTQAIVDFGTDIIPEAELTPYARFKYLSFCSEYGVDSSDEAYIVGLVLKYASDHVEGLAGADTPQTDNLIFK